VICEDLAGLQTQLRQQEIRHNQELVIFLRGVNRNTRQLGVVTQQLENPQQPANSDGTGESRLLSYFHSTVNKDHHAVPTYPGFADCHYVEENLDHHYTEENPTEANLEAQPAEHREDFE